MNNHRMIQSMKVIWAMSVPSCLVSFFSDNFLSMRVPWNIVSLRSNISAPPTHIVIQVYHRTVLVIYREADELNILLASGGVPFALGKLARSRSLAPSLDDKKMFDYILKHAPAGDTATFTAMADYTLLWKDLELFKRIVTASGAEKNPTVIGQNNLIEAYSTFSFEEIRSMYDHVYQFVCT